MLKNKLIKTLDKYFTHTCDNGNESLVKGADKMFKGMLVDDILQNIEDYQEPDYGLIFSRMQDLFPDNVVIGGSWAYNKALGLPKQNNDIDLFICNDVGMASYMFTSILKNIIFEGMDITISVGGDHQYKMKSIKKRFVVDLDGFKFDFIFTRSTPKHLVMHEQGSTISEVVYPLSCVRGVGAPIMSHDFKKLKDSVEKRNDIYFHIREGQCTAEHLVKIDNVLENIKKLFAKR